MKFPLTFKDNYSAFEYSCKYMDCKIKKGAELPAIVLDMTKINGVTKSISVGADGIQTALLLVSSDGGGRRMLAGTVSKSNSLLKVGDFVSWFPAYYKFELFNKSPYQLDGWFGVISGILTPTLAQEGWIGQERF